MRFREHFCRKLVEIKFTRARKDKIGCNDL